MVRLTSAVIVGLIAFAPLTGQADEDLETNLEFCAGCHGEDGRPIEADYPIIWGQEFYYLYVQLRDYKSGRRENEIMQGIAEDLSKEQMQALAQHFSEQQWPETGFGAADADINQGKTATAGGQCTQCHLGGYNGNSRNPRLAGQNPEYLNRTMLEFKNRVRMNAPDKGSLFRSYDDSDISAMANYLAGF